MFQTKFLENIKPHFMLNNFFSKMAPFMRECGKIFTFGQAKDDNMAQVRAHTHTHTHTH